jgi:hypothetical protein
VYSTGQHASDANGVCYLSKANSNVGNPLTDTSKWEQLSEPIAGTQNAIRSTELRFNADITEETVVSFNLLGSGNASNRVYVKINNSEVFSENGSFAQTACVYRIRPGDILVFGIDTQNTSSNLTAYITDFLQGTPSELSPELGFNKWKITTTNPPTNTQPPNQNGYPRMIPTTSGFMAYGPQNGPNITRYAINPSSTNPSTGMFIIKAMVEVVGHGGIEQVESYDNNDVSPLTALAGIDGETFTTMVTKYCSVGYETGIQITTPANVTNPATVTITVLEYDEVAMPYSISITPSAVNVDMPINTEVGTLTTNGGTGPYYFELSSDFEPNDNSKFSIVENKLYTSEVFSQPTTYSIEITVWDSGDASYTDVKLVDVIVPLDTIDVTSFFIYGKIVCDLPVDPRVTGVTYLGLPLPAGSVVRYTKDTPGRSDDQKFLAGGTSATDFLAIEITPPAAWGFSADGDEAWETLQAL